MTFIDPNADPTGIGGFVGGNPGIPPIVQTLPQTTAAFQRRYTPANVKTLRSHFDPDVVNSFLKFEQKRVANGQYPLTVEQAVKVLQTAQTRHAATEAPERNPMDLLGNVASDVGDLVTSIPKMPGQIATDIMHAPDTLKALSSGDVNKILTAPIVRLIPGAYTAHNLINGDFNEIVTHPAMTALDILPYAAKAHLGGIIDDIPVKGTTIGELRGRAGDVIGRSLPGQFARNTWGADTRELSAMGATESAVALERMNPAMRFVHDDNLSVIAQDNAKLLKDVSGAFDNPERAQQVFHAFETGNLDSIDLTDAEAGAVEKVRTASGSLERYGLDMGQLAQRDYGGVQETVTPEQAATLDKIRGKLTRRETITNTRNAILDPATLDVDALSEQVAREVNGNAPIKVKRQIVSGFVHALDAAGYDTGTLLAEVNKGPFEQTPTVSDIVQRAQGPTEGAVRVRRKTGAPALESRDRWLEQHRNMTSKTLETARRRSTALESRVLPARWQPLFQDMKVDRARGIIEQKYAPDDPALPTALENIHNHIFSDFAKEDIAAIDKEILAEIPRLRAAGVDPEFMHHVSPDQAAAMSSPTVTSIIPKPSQYRARINDWTPHVDSFSVALNHQALELIRAQQARVYVDEIRNNLTTPIKDGEAELTPAARRAAARNGTSYGVELERLMRKEFVRWADAESGFTSRDARRVNFTDTHFRPDDLLLRKHLAKALDQMANPPTYSRMLDPVTKVFRYSVLPLSPRFHVNNIFGGAIFEALEAPEALARVPEGMALGRDLMNMHSATLKGEFRSLDEATQSAIEHMPKRMRAGLGGLAYSLEPEGVFKMKAGKQLGEMAQEAGVRRLMRSGVDRFKAGVDWSFRANEMVDTGYRMSAYLSEFDKQIKKGISPEEAGVRAMALANKFMPRWLEQTPMERSVMRAVFPFYAFMSHVFQFAARYPIDHPWRTSVMSGLARAELNDFGTGIPQMLASAFFIGSPDKSGNQKVIDIGAANPFRDFGDQLTLAGFLGQTNPVFKLALRQLGYDPDARGPNLYPEIEYDPDTGRFRQVNKGVGGLAGQFVTDIIPQAELIPAFLGTSSEFKQLLRSNPEAAQRMLLGSVGVPLVYRKIPLDESMFKAELNREQDASTVWSHALKTGDYSRARRYPSLVPMIEQIEQANDAGKLQPYIPGQATSQLENKLS